MRIRFWIGLLAVFAIGGGSIAAALVVHAQEVDNFHKMQRDQATRSAHQAEALAALSVGQLASASAFFRAEGNFSAHEFEVIAEPLLQDGALSGTAFIQAVPAAGRRTFERRHGVPIFEPTADGPQRAQPRAEYFPITFAVSQFGGAAPVGYDLSSDPRRAPYLRRARDRGIPVATAPVKLLIGGLGINVYRPVYRDGVPTATVAERRRALLGFAAGAFRIQDLARAAIGSVPDTSEVQLHVGGGSIVGDQGKLVGSAKAPVQIADRTWLLVVRDPNRPEVGLPLLLGGVGISLAALLAALIVVWTRNERMQELEREASEDPLTGLGNRRSFEEDLRREMARARRHRSPGAMLMIDLDHFKRVNDTRGHPAGDRLIRQIASLLRQRVRESDVLARLGGDEFAVVLPDTRIDEARVVAESIVAAIRDHSAENGGEPVTASAGIAIFGEDPRLSPESIVSEADTAMYAAKDGGRDGVRVFDHEFVRDGGDG